MGKVTELKLDGKAYVVLPRAMYLRLRKGDVPAGTVDALEYADAAIAYGLRAARDAAGLTQVQLAEKLGKSQGMVSAAEAGRMQVGERYVAAVVKACGLPPDWKAPKKKGGK